MPTYQDFDAAWKKAQQANEQRYAEILSGYQNLATTSNASRATANQAILQGYDERYGRIMAELAGAGASQEQEITDAYAKERGRASQGLISRGLGNTTVRSSVDRGLQESEQKSRVQLQDTLTRQKTEYDKSLSAEQLAAVERAREAEIAQQAALTQQTLQFMERRQDAYPDLGLYAQMAQMQGAANQPAPPYVMSGRSSSAAGGNRSLAPTQYASIDSTQGGYNPYSRTGQMAAAPTAGSYGTVQSANPGISGFTAVAPGNMPRAGGGGGGGGGYGGAGGGPGPGGGEAVGWANSQPYVVGQPYGSQQQTYGGGMQAYQQGQQGAYDYMSQYTNALQQAMGGGQQFGQGMGGQGQNWSQQAWGQGNPYGTIAQPGFANYARQTGNLGVLPGTNTGGAGSNWSQQAWTPRGAQGVLGAATSGGTDYFSLLGQLGGQFGMNSNAFAQAQGFGPAANLWGNADRLAQQFSAANAAAQATSNLGAAFNAGPATPSDPLLYSDEPDQTLSLFPVGTTISARSDGTAPQAGSWTPVRSSSGTITGWRRTG
jgi:hypothetical protein